MSTLWQALFTRINHSTACLPYNLNWKVDAKPLRGFLSSHPLVVFDAGARGGGMGELAGLSRFVKYVGFDADEVECKRLMANPPDGYKEYRIYPYFLGEGGSVDFHLYSDPGMCSTYEINPEFNRVFLESSVHAERTVRLKSAALDDVALREQLEAPDLLKLDTQGSELSILRGARHTLARTAFVEVEVEFCPMYEGQPLFSDVDVWMRSHGFELLYLNRCFLPRKRFYKGLSRGQLIFADALYGRAPSQLGGFSAERIANYIILLCHYGHLDLARQIYSEHPEAGERCPGLSRCFPRPPSLMRRGLVLQFDKLICLALHARRTNHVFADSDRAWPIR
ncbi:MAG: FkbM family methyltransferase [Candidatus Sulfotelmatobacter sp.]|jgi:FkbM family methyltransferase